MSPTSFACSEILDRGVRAELAGDWLPLAARAFDSRCHDATEAA
jgi:hypothetical protein